MSDISDVNDAHQVPNEHALADAVFDTEAPREQSEGDMLMLVPSGFKLVPDVDDPDIELLKMKVSELEAILEDRRLRTNAMEASLHALHHDDRKIEDIFDAVYGKLRGGS